MTTVVAIIPMALSAAVLDCKGRSDLRRPPSARKTVRRAAGHRADVRADRVCRGLCGDARATWARGFTTVTRAVPNAKTTETASLPCPHSVVGKDGWLKKNPWFEEECFPGSALLVRELYWMTDATPLDIAHAAMMADEKR